MTQVAQKGNHNVVTMCYTRCAALSRSDAYPDEVSADKRTTPRCANSRGLGRTIQEFDMGKRTRYCTAQFASGEFCDTVSADDMPFPVCARHALKVFERISELSDTERAALSPSVRVVLTGPSQRRDRNSALAALCKGKTTVYAVRCADGIIKIGYSANLPQRMSQLGPTVDLIAFQFADFYAEQAIHAGLAEHRARGREWYHPHPAVMSVVNAMRADLGLPDIAA